MLPLPALSIGLVAPYHFNLIEGVRAGADGGAVVAAVEVLEYDNLHGLRLLFGATTTVLIGAVIWIVVRSLEHRAVGYVPESTPARLRMLRIAFVVTWVLPTLIGMAAGFVSGNGFDPVWNDPATLVAVVGYLAVAALALRLSIDARKPWARSPGEAGADPGQSNR